MDHKEIIKRIKVILENPRSGGDLRFYKTHKSEKEKDVYRFCNKTVELLLALFQKLSSAKEKNFFQSIMGMPFGFSKRIMGIPIYSLIYSRLDFIVMFFIKSGKIDAVLEGIKTRKSIGAKDEKIFCAIREILHCEPSIFNEDRLDVLELIVRNFKHIISSERVKKAETLERFASFGLRDPSRYSLEISDDTLNIYEDHLKKIEEQISKIRFERYESELLEGLNLETNQDKEELKVKIKEFNFNPELNKCLDKVDSSLQKAEDEFDLKTSIDLIRTFIEKLVISVASEIVRNINIQPSEKLNGKIGRARNYFRSREVQFLSENEDNLLGAIYGFMSYVGTHTLTSDKEYARIARNITIEKALFLVKKLDKYIEKKQEKKDVNEKPLD